MSPQRMGRGSALVIVIATLSMSCASNPARASRAPQNSGAANNVLTAAEMIRVAPDQSLWTAIERARPVWLLPGRGSVATASVDGSPLMELSMLRTIPVSHVHEVRLQRGIDNGGRPAVLRNGEVVVGDVIIVLTRRR